MIPRDSRTDLLDPTARATRGRPAHGRLQLAGLADLRSRLTPKLDAMHGDKVVFVDFDDAVPWTQVISTMDTIRSIASDENHDDIKVALEVRQDPPARLP